MSIRSLTGDEYKPGTPFRVRYDAVKASGLFRDRKGQSFFADIESGYFALGHGVHPPMQLMEILKDRVARGEISNADSRLFSCAIGSDDLESGVKKQKELSPVAKKIFDELDQSGLMEELPIGAKLYIDPVSGLFQVNSADAVSKLVKRIQDEQRLLQKDVDAEIDIASRLEVGKTPWRDREEIRNTVRWGVLDLLTMTVKESVEVPVGREKP